MGIGDLIFIILGVVGLLGTFVFVSKTLDKYFSDSQR